MADFTPQTVVETGLAASLSAVSASDTLSGNDGTCMLVVVNGGGSPDTVTITANGAIVTEPGKGSVAKANAGGSVPAGATRYFGPFPALAFHNGNGQIPVTHSFVTSVTAAFIKLPRAA